MGNLNPKPVEIEFDGKTYGVTFNLNLIDDVQTRFDKSLDEIPAILTDDRTAAANLRYVLTALLNDAIETREMETGEELPRLTEQQVGKKIDIHNFDYYYAKIFEAFGCSLPDTDEDDDPNPRSGQQSSMLPA